MSRMKTIFAVLMLTAIVGIVPLAQAQTLKVVIAGSSALWQTAALGTFGTPSTATAGEGTCSSLLTGCTSPTFHWTSAKSGANEPYLNDTRPTSPVQDLAPTWVVWDSAAVPNVWVFAKVDSAVGDRCYFARPACTVVLPTAAPVTGANLISVWDNSACGTACDTSLPASIQALLNNGITVSVAASDIRPEDAAFAQARANSALGASTYSSGGSDGLDGLGYNSNNAAGVPATYPAGTTHGVGNPFLSGMPGSTQQANVLAFNISGKDPFTDTATPAFTVTDIGGEPVVFVVGRQDSLAGLTNATDTELQQVFSGNTCDASAFAGQASAGINIFLRESLSGTYNTIEASVFRHPTIYTGSSMAAGTGVLGISQEANIGPISVGTVGTATTANDPLTALSINPNTSASVCVPAGNPTGKGGRYRGIGTGEVVEGILCSHNGGGSSCFPGTYQTAQDGIAYSFFSYGNVKSIAGSNNYGYIRLDGVDPIFQSYTATTLDPGQPTQTALGGFPAGTLPLHTPCLASKGADFPCQESLIWANGFSFPNVRNGLYRAWNILRTIATGTANTNIGLVVKASQAYVVSSVPDYIPYTAVTCNATTVPSCSPTVSDLGLKLLRSHYEQRDGNGTKFGTAVTKNTATEGGGDMGGFIIPDTIGVTTEGQLQLVGNAATVNGHLVYDPVQRPQ
jgi:hypothetical protein